jgi:hypothetical protein
MATPKRNERSWSSAAARSAMARGRTGGLARNLGACLQTSCSGAFADIVGFRDDLMDDPGALFG